jgi:hypothetical protein
MFALIYQVLLRFFGFGGAAAIKPSLAGSLRYSPGFAPPSDFGTGLGHFPHLAIFVVMEVSQPSGLGTERG